MKKFLLTALTASLLTGCVAFPSDYKKPFTEKQLKEQMRDKWSDTPAVTYIDAPDNLVSRRFDEIPAKLANQPVRLALRQASGANVDDVIYALREQGFRVISRLKDTVGKKEVQLTSFKGTFGQLVQELSDSYNIAYEYRNGAVYLMDVGRYFVNLPPNEELLKGVASQVKARGATDAQYDQRAGQVYYTATPDQEAEIAEYLETISRNSAMVYMQVAVVTMDHNRSNSQGWDWTQALAQFGTSGRSPYAQSVANSATSDSNSTGTATSSTTALAKGMLVGFTGGTGMSGAFTSNSFNLTAAIQALSTFGNTRTEQNVLLNTLSYTKTSISSGQDIPYVSNIGAATSSGGSTSSSTSTAVAKSGLRVNITPVYSALNNTVSLSVTVDLSSLIGFITMNTGSSSSGTISQPKMQNMNFENQGIPQVGDTLIIGGITYDQLARNYTSLPGMEEKAMGSEAETLQRQSLIIAIRPTVVVFRHKDINIKHIDVPSVAVKVSEDTSTDSTPANAKKHARKPHGKAHKTGTSATKVTPVVTPLPVPALASQVKLTPPTAPAVRGSSVHLRPGQASGAKQ